MPNMKERADMVLVGAGIAGCATAACLLRAAPELRVIMLDRAHVGAGSTSRSMAAFRHQWSVPAHVSFSKYASQSYMEMADRGVPVGFRRNGYLFLYHDPEVFRQARARVGRQRSLGVEGVSDVTAGELQRAVSCGHALETDGIVGGVFGSQDGWLDPLAVAQAYLAEAREAGLDYRPDTAVTGIRQSGGAVRGVRITGGHIEAERLLVCAGPWSPQVTALLDLDLPVRPAKRYLYHTRPLRDTRVEEWPLVIAPGGAHCRPGEGNTLVLAWEARPEPLERFPEGDGLWENQDLIEEGFGLSPEEWGIAILSRLAEFLPLLAEQASLAHVTCGWYSVTPDHKAILSEDPRLTGLYHASGFSGHGIMHGPANGLCMAELMLGLTPTLLTKEDLTRQFGLAP
ncbi:NAD(P)/FAD-dependent oxidoreductase, partial [Gemmatimonadota bacterium]